MYKAEYYQPAENPPFFLFMDNGNEVEEILLTSEKRLWDEEKAELIRGYIRDSEKLIRGIAYLTPRIVMWIPAEPEYYGCEGINKHKDL